MFIAGFVPYSNRCLPEIGIDCHQKCHCPTSFQVFSTKFTWNEVGQWQAWWQALLSAPISRRGTEIHKSGQCGVFRTQFYYSLGKLPLCQKITKIQSSLLIISVNTINWKRQSFQLLGLEYNYCRTLPRLHLSLEPQLCRKLYFKMLSYAGMP
jgi:hypothetical protein